MPIFSRENRTRLFYLLGDVLNKPLMDGFGGYEGPRDFFVLDELLRRHLGRLQLMPGFDAPESILEFIQNASESELLDMIELVPTARVKAAGFGSREALFEANESKKRFNAYLKAIGSPASFQKDGNFYRDGFLAVAGTEREQLPKKDNLDQDLRALVSQSEPTGLILFDLDGFKAVNEKNGYNAGDKCLDAVVEATLKSIARKGKLYRFREGDEFAVVLRNAVHYEAAAVAERIRQSIETCRPGGDVPVTASFGAASSFQDLLGSAEALLHAAEETLHVSKYTTKNCVTVWPVSDEVLAQVRENRDRSRGR
jgi:diguanylate cyclase (GGDEF)-like protein